MSGRVAKTASALEPAERGPTLSDFFRMRNEGGPVLLDRYTTNNVAFAVAYLSARAGLTPNQVSVASGVVSAIAFIASLLLPVDPLWPSVVIVFVLAQSAYVLDCADGQLARCTNRTSEFGAFLDTGVDVVGGILALGAFFCLLYRHFVAMGQPDTGTLVLACGFVFLTARTARICVSQSFSAAFGERERKSGRVRSRAEEVLLSLMDMQVSLFAILVATLSVPAALLIFAAQSVLQTLAYLRYFVRAKRAAGQTRDDL